MVKVFLAHAKGDEDAVLTQSVAALTEALKKDSPELEVVITLGRDDYNAEIARAGSWKEWAQSVTFRYDVIVVNRRIIGKATAQMLDAALSQNRPVLIFEDGLLVHMRAIQTTNAKNFVSGWRITT